MSLRPPVEVTWFVPLLAIAASLMAAASRAPGALRPRNLRWHRQSGRLAPSLRPGPRSRVLEPKVLSPYLPTCGAAPAPQQSLT